MADTDDDGMISLQEWARMLRAMGARDAAIEERLAAMDTDGDGRISEADVLASTRGYYTTNDVMPAFNNI